MDGYVSKPIDVTELAKALNSVAKSKTPEPFTPEAKPSPSALALDVALAQVDGDTELLAEVINLFLSDCPRMLNRIRQAFDRKDASALREAAHSMKGTLGAFGAHAAVGAAYALEQGARDGDLSATPDLYLRLEQEISNILPALAGYLGAKEA